MLNRVTIFAVGLLLTANQVFGQNLEKLNDIPVSDAQGSAYSNPWSGGIDAGQISQIDLDFDGKLDLFVFDRIGSKISTFINEGQSNEIKYRYAPEYEKAFPDSMTEWALLRDYNNDGNYDIFTYNNAGTRIYKNIGDQSTGLKFELKIDILQGQYLSGETDLYTPRTDIPSITDIDSDGDLDILTFGVVSTQVHFFENFAIDSNDIEDFKMHGTTYCWGNFEEDLLTNKVDLNVPCPTAKAKSGNKHAGSTLTAFDEDGDGDMDLLLGDISYNTMIFLENGGDQFYADMTRQDVNYPSYGDTINIPIFPAAYIMDINNDGKDDMISIPNASTGLRQNFEGVHLYLNTSTTGGSNFSLHSTSFLQNQMLEFGSGAFPAIFDHNFDGLQDLVVGNDGYFNGVDFRISKLHLFENTGTQSQPAYKLIDDDYAGLTQLDLDLTLEIPTVNVAPTFADVNADGYADLIVGDYNGKVHLFYNSPSNSISEFNLQVAELEDSDGNVIDVGDQAMPQLFDLNRDGLQDLIIGNFEGFLTYYENTGTVTEPKFTRITNKLGGVKTAIGNEFRGYAQPFFYQSAGVTELLCGSFSGVVFYYRNIDGNLDGDFDLVTTQFGDIDVGERSHLTMADLDNDDEIEFLIGNECGGLNYFNSDFNVAIEEIETSSIAAPFDFKLKRLSSNLVELNLNKTNGKAQVEVISITGQLQFEESFTANIKLDLSSMSKGVYLFKVVSGSDVKTKKYIYH